MARPKKVLKPVEKVTKHPEKIVKKKTDWWHQNCVFILPKDVKIWHMMIVLAFLAFSVVFMSILVSATAIRFTNFENRYLSCKNSYNTLKKQAEQNIPAPIPPMQPPVTPVVETPTTIPPIPPLSTTTATTSLEVGFTTPTSISTSSSATSTSGLPPKTRKTYCGRFTPERSSLPRNTIPTAPNGRYIQQSYDGGKTWAPTKQWTYSTETGECTFTCKTGFTWNGTACL